MTFEKHLGYLSFQKPVLSVNVIKELFKESLYLSSFYKFFTDRRTAMIKGLTVTCYPDRFNAYSRTFKKTVAIEVSELYLTFVLLI